MGEAFDFEKHRTRAYESYGAIRERYVRYAATIENILRMALREVPTHNISARAKDIESFAAKASKPDPDNPDKPKYPDPIREIEDLAGARVITYVLRAISQAEEAIEKEFDVVERHDKADGLLEKGQVGYRSIHFVVRMKSDRAKLLEYREFDGLRAEVQVRTILQHAWAEIEHDMRYKPSAEPNKELSQRFTALAGVIEVADREFDQIYEIDDRRRRELIDLAQIDDMAPEPKNSGKKNSKADNPLPQPKAHLLTEIDLSSAQPKELMALRRYRDAIIRYNELIYREPKQFAHYLGRSKARFLYGDMSGALEDIATAESISPDHPFIARVKDLIEGRQSDGKPSSDQGLAVRQGHTALREGNAKAALSKYEEAETLGFSPVFSIFNRAMARFLMGELQLSRQTLDRIDPYPGSTLEFNVIVLRTLCYLMAGGEKKKEALQIVSENLQRMIEVRGYQYNERSPLFDLEAGANKALDQKALAKIAGVFDILRSNAEEHATDTAAHAELVV